MPHIIVKMYPGRTQEQKEILAQKIADNVVEVTQCKPSVVSVAIEEISPDIWDESVYRPDILESEELLYVKPGYNPFESESEQADDTKELMDYVRGASEQAALEDSSGMFNPMSWLDLELEDNPGTFDRFFDQPWHELSDQEKADRCMTIRRVL